VAPAEGLNYVKAKPVLEDIELFDASFFGFNPREAEITDPQHRLFLGVLGQPLKVLATTLKHTQVQSVFMLVLVQAAVQTLTC